MKTVITKQFIMKFTKWGKEEKEKQLKEEYCQLEKEYADLKQVCKARGDFMDWCSKNHENVMNEYLGF